MGKNNLPNNVAPRQARDDYKPRVLVIAGPTASGKSDVAIRLAQKFNGEIISADSRQVYRGMDIGTGKVRRDSRKAGVQDSYFSEGIRHWMLDVAGPRIQYSVAQWRRGAERAIREITRRGKLPIICGGTGFWIDALVYDLSLPAVAPDAKLRARLARMSPGQLYARLKKLDPARAANIDRHNPVRLIRALEIVLKTGRPVPRRKNGSPFEPLYLAISVPREKLARRIARRLDARLKAGMVSEVRRLRAQGVSFERLESFGLEYRWLSRFLRGSTSGKERLNLKSMRDGLLRDITAYSRRQMTWWRKNPDIVWVRNANEAIDLVRSFLVV